MQTLTLFSQVRRQFPWKQPGAETGTRIQKREASSSPLAFLDSCSQQPWDVGFGTWGWPGGLGGGGSGFRVPPWGAMWGRVPATRGARAVMCSTGCRQAGTTAVHICTSGRRTLLHPRVHRAAAELGGAALLFCAAGTRGDPETAGAERPLEPPAERCGALQAQPALCSGGGPGGRIPLTPCCAEGLGSTELPGADGTSWASLRPRGASQRVAELCPAARRVGR